MSARREGLSQFVAPKAGARSGAGQEVLFCAQVPPEQQIVNDAADALGGRARLLAVKTIVIEGTGLNGNLDQDMTPDATGQAFTLTGYRRAIDVAAGRMRIEQTRTPTFTYFQGQQHDLTVDRIVPIHGAIAPFSEFLKAVSP